MRTAIVSDLHLGSAHGEDLLRDPGIRATLFEEVRSADRLVLLGDALELRELPLAPVLDASRPFFEELGEAMAGREIVLVPGNHDHRLAEPLLERFDADGPGPLAHEQRGGAEGGPASELAAWLGGTELAISYPGIWLRDDVYATHGHYMDCHMSLPRIECLAAALVMRSFGPLADPATAADYERVLRPVYGLAYGLAQSGYAAHSSRPSEKAWELITGRSRAKRRYRRAVARAAAGAGVPAGIWALNRVLRTEFRLDLSVEGITRSGIDAATELARRLGVDAEHVITGHTHRAGPHEGEAEWRLPGGGRLHNTGSWIFASAFHRPGTPPGPYWPGVVTWVEDDGPPRRERLLEDREREALRETTLRSRRASGVRR